MTALLHPLKDSTLTTFLYVQGALVALLGFWVSLRPVTSKRGRVLHTLLFLLFCGLGIALTSEQARRSDEQTKSLASSHDIEAAAHQKEQDTLDAVQKVVTTMSDSMTRGKFQEAFQTALSSLSTLSQTQATMGKEIVAQEKAAHSSSEATLLDRAEDLDKKLNGLHADWDAQLYQADKRIKDRWDLPEYTKAVEPLKSEMLNSDREEIRFFQQAVNRRETKFYRENYEVKAKALRAELVPKVPGIGNVDIDYHNSEGGMLGFESICDTLIFLPKLTRRAFIKAATNSTRVLALSRLAKLLCSSMSPNIPKTKSFDGTPPKNLQFFRERASSPKRKL